MTSPYITAFVSCSVWHGVFLRSCRADGLVSPQKLAPVVIQLLTFVIPNISPHLRVDDRKASALRSYTVEADPFSCVRAFSRVPHCKPLKHGVVPQRTISMLRWSSIRRGECFSNLAQHRWISRQRTPPGGLPHPLLEASRRYSVIQVFFARSLRRSVNCYIGAFTSLVMLYSVDVAH